MCKRGVKLPCTLPPQLSRITFFDFDVGKILQQLIFTMLHNYADMLYSECWLTKDSCHTLQRSEAGAARDCNTATAVTTKLQRSNAACW